MTQLSKHNAKQMLRRDLVKYGVSDFASLRKLMPPYMHYAFEESVMSRWAAGMDRGPRFGVPPKQPRLVNRFMLGADPEFVFAMPYGEQQRIRAAEQGIDVVRQRDGAGNYIASVAANTVGLKTGLAFGADQNGRLVELRVKPSRFALEVLGSTLDTLRWLKATVGDPGLWIAGAWQFEDGLGGHVHFGRKRNLITTEAAALDYVMEHLLVLGVFPQEEHNRRTAGDRRGQVYGRYFRDDPVHAVRRQQHGYEYRTYPSWLDSPQQAYLTLVLSKLVCHDPGLMSGGQKSQFEQRVFNILRFYQGRDDDAAICLAMLRRSGFPRHNGGDFKGRWGLNGIALVGEDYVIPRAIAASRNTLGELLGHLLNGTALPSALPAPTWEPSKIPADGRWAMTGLETRGNPGMGEILADMVSSRRMPVEVFRSEASWLEVGGKLAKQLGVDWKKQVRAVLPPKAATGHRRDGSNGIGIGLMLREDPALARKLLTCGVFPLWKMKDFKATSLDEWRARNKAENKQEEAAVPIGKGKLLHDLRA